MKRLLAMALVAVLTLPATARAEDAPAAPERSRTSLAPVAGAAFGTWTGVPVTRAVVGLELAHPIADGVAAQGLVLVEPGRTESGLGAHRVEVGPGLFLGPKWLQIGAGIHGTYAMLVRVTKDDAFWRALGTDIGGFGVGVHVSAQVAVPVSRYAVLLAVRAAYDLYDGGKGSEVAPTLGFRF